MAASRGLVPKRIRNVNGVETTVHVRPDQQGALDAGPLSAVAAPPAAGGSARPAYIDPHRRLTAAGLTRLRADLRAEADGPGPDGPGAEEWLDELRWHRGGDQIGDHGADAAEFLGLSAEDLCEPERGGAQREPTEEDRDHARGYLLETGLADSPRVAGEAGAAYRANLADRIGVPRAAMDAALQRLDAENAERLSEQQEAQSMLVDTAIADIGNRAPRRGDTVAVMVGDTARAVKLAFVRDGRIYGNTVDEAGGLEPEYIDGFSTADIIRPRRPEPAPLSADQQAAYTRMSGNLSRWADTNLVAEDGSDWRTHAGYVQRYNERLLDAAASLPEELHERFVEEHVAGDRGRSGFWAADGTFHPIDTF